MNELSNDVNYGEMKAELQALRKKLEDLESKQAAFKGGTDRTVRRRFPKTLVITCVSLVALLVAGGALWGDEAIKALFIDSKGNVGIGTIQPSQKLDVTGTTVTDGIALSRDNVKRYAMFFAYPGDFNHALYNDNSNIDGEGKKDEIKWNSINGFDFRVGPRGGKSGLSIRKDGNIGIGTTDDPKAKLDVNGTLNVTKNASIGGALMVPAGNVGLGVNTAPEKLAYRLDVNGSVNASQNLSVGNVVTANRIGIGKAPGQEVALDVAGEIRGKPWVSGEYEWKGGKPFTLMTRVDRSVCFLVSYFGGSVGEAVWIGITEQTDQKDPSKKVKFWFMQGQSGRDSFYAKARCIGTPDDSY